MTNSRSRAQLSVEQQISTSIIPLLPAKHIFCTDIRHEFVVDTYPGLSWSIVQVTIRVEDVEGVVSARSGLTVMVEGADELVLDGISWSFCKEI